MNFKEIQIIDILMILALETSMLLPKASLAKGQSSLIFISKKICMDRVMATRRSDAGSRIWGMVRRCQ